MKINSIEKKVAIALLLIVVIFVGNLPFSEALAYRYYDHNVMITSSANPLAKNYEPYGMVYMPDYVPATSGRWLLKEPAQQYVKMYNAMRAEGLYDLKVLSAYRSYSYQEGLFNNEISYYQQRGYSYADAYNLAKKSVAVPGISEHQTGLAIDVSNTYSLSESFANTGEGKWLATNAYKYGFVLSYPKEKISITGTIFEPWHYRYVGYAHAKIMKQNNWILREYYNYLMKNGSITLEEGNRYKYQVIYTTRDDLDVPDLMSVSITNTGAYILTRYYREPDPLNVTVDGQKVSFDKAIYKEDNTVMAPLRTLAETMAANVTWDGETDSAIIKKEYITARFKIGEKTIKIEDEMTGKTVTKPLVVASVLKDGSTFSPIRAIAEALEYHVSWADETQTVKLDNNIKVRVDGEQVLFETPLAMESNTCLVPVRTLAESIGASVGWDSDMAIVETSDVRVKFKIGDVTMIYEDKIKGEIREVTMPVAARLQLDKTYVPIRIISEALDFNVSWNNNMNTVLLDKKV